MARKLKPEDKHVTRKELLAELLVLARATDASIAQLRAEWRAGIITPLSENDYVAESTPRPESGQAYVVFMGGPDAHFAMDEWGNTHNHPDFTNCDCRRPPESIPSPDEGGE